MKATRQNEVKPLITQGNTISKSLNRTKCQLPLLCFSPWHSTPVEGRMDQHRYEGPLTVEDTRTKGSGFSMGPGVRERVSKEGQEYKSTGCY